MCGTLVDDVVGRDVVLVMIGTEVACRHACVCHLVVAVASKPIEIRRAGRPVTSPTMPATVELSVPPLRKQPTARASSDARDRATQNRRNSSRSAREVGRRRFDEMRRPPTRHGQPALFHERIVARRQPPNASMDRPRRRNHVEVEVVEDRLGVCRHTGRRQNVGAGMKDDLAVHVHSVAKGADRKSIDGEEHPSRSVADGDGEATAGLGRRRHSMTIECCNPRRFVSASRREVGELRVRERERACAMSAGRVGKPQGLAIDTVALQGGPSNRHAKALH